MKLLKIWATVVILVLASPVWAQQWDGSYSNPALIWQGYSPANHTEWDFFSAVDSAVVSGNNLRGHLDFHAITGTPYAAYIDWTATISSVQGTQGGFLGTGVYADFGQYAGGFGFHMQGLVQGGVLQWVSTDFPVGAGGQQIGDAALTLLTAPVPEPGTAFQLLVGLAALVGVARCSRTQQANNAFRRAG